MTSITLLPQRVDKEIIPTMQKMLEWRNVPEVMAGLYSQKDGKKITWKEHVKWFQSRNQDWRTFMIIYNDMPVGTLTIGNLDHWAAEIGWLIGEPLLWGRGIGKEAVRLGLKYIKVYGRQYARTTILDNNERSITLATGLGFKRLGPAREGESWYQAKL